MGDETEWSRFRELVAGTKDQLLSLGFPKFTLEDFYDSVIILQHIVLKSFFKILFDA